MKKHIKYLLILVLFMIPNCVCGSSINPSKSSAYSHYDYVIDSYDVSIVVNENNTFDITESIAVHFNMARHGIYRAIPLKNTVTRLDGSTTTNRVKISNVNVNNDFSISREDNSYIIKIGSDATTVTGTQKYVISYNYDIGKDPLKDKDEFYFNIIGKEWNTIIGNITFSITMPKEFDSNLLGFSSGTYGSTANENVNYVVNGNIITGSYNGILGAGEALTVRLELEEGYFSKASYVIECQDILYIVPLVLLILSILIWFKYGKEKKPVITVEFYPPVGFNSLEVGFLYKGRADNKDVVSLLIYLANLGYISIAETEEKNLFHNSKGFKLKKLKEYDGNNINEKMFLDNLFVKKAAKEDDQVPPVGSEVTSHDLYNNFYLTIDKILNNVNKKENRYKIFDKNSLNKNIILFLFIVITFIIITIGPFLYSSDVSTYLMIGLFPAIGVICLINGIINVPWKKGKIVNIIFGIVFTFPLHLIIEQLWGETMYLIGYLYGVIMVAGIMYIIKIMPKRTAWGNELLGKIKGLRNFLETAEKDKLEVMVTENPNYFYDILPYTYVLGVSDKWIEKFETIAVKEPSWYDDPSGFSVNSFSSFMNSTMKSAQTAMTAGPSGTSEGSSSSFSSGGSSGGGSGGGGGGSW